jgi:hypothetical protein
VEAEREARRAVNQDVQLGRRAPGRAVRLCAMALLLCGPVGARVGLAQQSDPEQGSQSRIERLEQQVEILAEEIADLKSEEGVPEELDPTLGIYGLGPSASKVYHRDKGLAIGGYGDVRFRAFVEDKDDQTNIYDTLRLVLYAGYKWTDWLVFNSEIEFEHADTGNNGDVAVEFLTVDFLLRPWLNFRTGLVLIPMGFINEVHEPPFYFGAERPEVERRIIPSTWRENGFGIFGDLDLGDAGSLGYRAYGVNGFDATGFDSGGLRGGRQKGSKALADHFAFVGRVDWDLGPLLPGALLGGSVYAGKSGQNQDDANTGMSVPDTFTTIYEVHAQYKAHGWTARGLFTQAFIDDAGGLSRALGKGLGSSVAKQMVGGYAELGYDVLPLFFPDTGMSLEPFFRFEHVDTQQVVASGFFADENQDFDVYVAGLSYKPIPQVVLKLDYRNFEPQDGKIADEVQASIGFVF